MEEKWEGNERRKDVLLFRDVHALIETSEHRLEQKLEAIAADVKSAVEGMRERHHSAINQQMGHYASLEVKLTQLSGSLDSMKEGMRHITNEFTIHEALPGHPDTMQWRATVGQEIKSLAKMAAVRSSILSSGVTGVVVGIVVYFVTRGG